MPNPIVTKVIAKDIYVSVEFPLTFLKDQLKILDMCEFNYNSTIPEEIRLKEEFNNLYDFLKGTIQGIEEQTG